MGSDDLVARVCQALERGAKPKTKRERIAARIEKLRQKYDESGNPLYAWEAYELAREGSMELPAWFLLYLDRAASTLRTLWMSNAIRGARIHREVAEAFELKTPGRKGRGTAFSDRHIEERDKHIGLVVVVERLTGKSAEEAIQTIAAANRLRRSSVRDIAAGFEENLAAERGIPVESLRALFKRVQKKRTD